MTRPQSVSYFDSTVHVHVAGRPRVTTHPQNFTNAKPGRLVMFSVENTGTEPLNYKWEWNQDGEGGGRELWQLCDWRVFQVQTVLH